MKRFECVDAQKAAGFPVYAACNAADVSTSGYYDWCARRTAGPSERQLDETVSSSWCARSSMPLMATTAFPACTVSYAAAVSWSMSSGYIASCAATAGWADSTTDGWSPPSPAPPHT